MKVYALVSTTDLNPCEDLYISNLLSQILDFIIIIIIIITWLLLLLDYYYYLIIIVDSVTVKPAIQGLKIRLRSRSRDKDISDVSISSY